MGVLFYCPMSAMPLKSAIMKKEVDINKVIRQHAEMEDFFTGGFTVKTHKAEQVQPQAGQTTEYSTVRTKQPQVDESTADIIAELEKIADETRQCRKCGLGSLRLNAVPGEGQAEREDCLCRRRPRGR